LVRSVAKRSSESATQTMKQTIVRDARLVEKFSPIEACPDSCDRIGRVRSKRLSLSSAVRSEPLLLDNPGLSPCPEVGILRKSAHCLRSSIEGGTNGTGVRRL